MKLNNVDKRELPLSRSQLMVSQDVTRLLSQLRCKNIEVFSQKKENVGAISYISKQKIQNRALMPNGKWKPLKILMLTVLKRTNRNLIINSKITEMDSIT